MKSAKIFAALALANLLTGHSFAQAPNSVGDSFISYGYSNGAGGVRGTGLLYLATDGTCRQLSASISESEGPGPIVPTYFASSIGTYTYTVETGTPGVASLIVTFPTSTAQAGYALSLMFTTATTGTGGYAPESPAGPIGFFSSTFTLLPHSENMFLVNVSNRVTLRPSDTAISGFVIQGSGSRLVLVRTVGPTLTQFGVSPVSPNPQLNLFSGTGTTQIASGGVWDSGASGTGGYDAQAMSWIFSMLGAFSLQPSSKDVAYFGLLSPGVYTAQSFDLTVSSAGGSALTEVYILPYSG
jgi:hypothetical protein